VVVTLNQAGRPWAACGVFSPSNLARPRFFLAGYFDFDSLFITRKRKKNKTAIRIKDVGLSRIPMEDRSSRLLSARAPIRS
jgi:hypothetical protein